MGDLLFGQQGAKQLGLLNAGGTHQGRSAGAVDLGGLVGDGLPFGGFGLIHLIGPVAAGAGPVGGHDRDLQLVGLLEFHLFRFGGASHARQARVEQEEVLVGDRCQGLGFRLDLQALLGFHRLVQAIAPAAARHHPTGEFIHDHRVATPNDVVDVFCEQFLGLEGVVDEVGPGVLRVEQILHPQQLLRLGVALVGERDVALLLVHLVIAFRVNAVLAHLDGALQLGGHLSRPAILLLGPLDLARDDQGGAGLVHQDRVHLVDHAVVEIALHHLGQVAGHVVAQVIEAQL